LFWHTSSFLRYLRRERGSFARFAAVLLLLGSVEAMVTAQTGRIAGPIDPQRVVPLKGGINPRVRREDDQGRVDGNTRLEYMTLLLQRSGEQREALERLLAEQQDSRSPNYHRWLTPEQFGERFGASRSDLNTLAEWLRSNGLTVESTARGRSWLVISGTARQVERTFGTEIHRYSTDGKLHFANAAPPSVPAAFEGLVAGIRGLDDFNPEPPSDFQPRYNTANVYHALAPSDFGTIYDATPLWNAGIDGTGQNIAIIGESVIDPADISSFRQMFGLPSQVPQQVAVGPKPAANDGAMAEADLDLEWAGAVAPNASLTYVYASNVFDAVSYAIDNNLAPVISFSFGTCEPNVPSDAAAAAESLAQQANAQGITWVVASGDAGPVTCDAGSDLPTHGLAVSFPASLTEVTGVGGTWLSGYGAQYWDDQTGSALSYIPEAAWNDTTESFYLTGHLTIAASGGGSSTLYPKPYWQIGLGVPNNNARNVPDLALAASLHNPYVVIAKGQQRLAGGTSASAPSFAGIVALLNHYLVSSGAAQQPGLGNINPMLYGIAHSAPEAFHDVTVGDNRVGCQLGTPDCDQYGYIGFQAGPGYDQVTGLGSLDVSKLSKNWNAAFAIGPPSQAPPAPMLIGPANGATGAPLSGPLTWRAAGNATSYDVYFGVTSPPPFWGNTTATSCAPSGLAGSTTYYWNVIAKNGAGSTASETRSFTTEVAYTISTVAGNGGAGYSGDSGPATQAQLKYPAGVAVDAAGNLYIADAGNARVRKVANGIITTVAGNGGIGFSGDGGPAVNAKLGPTSVAVDAAGNLYIADPDNCRIREVSNGIIATIAGSGAANNGACLSGGDGGPAIAAGLTNPVGVAVDNNGNVYVADRRGNRVSEIANGAITTVAGTGSNNESGVNGPAASAGLPLPNSLALDTTGNLYIANVYRLLEVSGGIITPITGECGSSPDVDTGPATNAAPCPISVAVDAAGDIFISTDTRIRKIANGIITTVAGNAGQIGFGGDAGPARNALMGEVAGTAVDTAGNVYLADNQNHRIRRLTPSPGGPASAPVPVISSGDIRNPASLTTAIAPGSVAAMWGNFVLGAVNQASGAPLPTTLAGLSVQVGTALAPLSYASGGQVNFQVPWEVAGQSQVLVTPILNGQPASPQSVQLVAVAPAIFTTGAHGTGQGVIVDGSGQLVDASNPASAGATVQISCTGLGAVNNPPPTGSLPSSDQPSTTINAPRVSIGGIDATVVFSGLDPSQVGAYQVQAIVPAGAPTGNAVPLVISIDGAVSNTVTLAIQ
jgi:uncharacterized protein (TIGR03437 family)